MEFTPEARDRLVDYLTPDRHIPRGLGNEEAACTIAAINLSISGTLTDDIPNCMSEVLGRATISLQDEMPADMRNGERYRRFIPTAAGTGREKEAERLAVLLDWMWGVVLPQLQPAAARNGYGDEWRAMCEERTEAAADAAYSAARDTSDGAGFLGVVAAYASTAACVDVF